MDETRRANLKRLFAPRSVAFIGGASALAAVKQCAGSGFQGDIWPVNPWRQEMAGYPCFASVRDLPCGPDAVFLAVPSEYATRTVSDLAEIGTGGIVSFTAGFGELGGEGKVLERKLIEACGDTVLVGPNCSGILNYSEGAVLWPFDHTGRKTERGPAFVTQSGMLGNTVTMNDRSLDFSYIISSGNQAMLGVEEFLEFLVDDPKVTAIALYIEGLCDVKRFADSAIRALNAGVPIVAQKVGTSEMGAQLTVTHTGSLSGADSLYQALFDRLGIIRVSSSVAMLETLKMVTIAGIPKGNRIAGFTCSGGDSTMLADGAEPAGLMFTALSEQATDEIKDLLPPIAGVGNPLDYTTPLWGHEEPLRQVFGAMVSDDYDAAIMVQDYPVPHVDEIHAPYEADARAFARAVNDAGIPGAVCSILPEDLGPRNRQTLIDGHIAPLQGIEDAMNALGAAVWLGQRRAAVQNMADLSLLEPVPVAGPLHTLNEANGKQRLAQAGMRVPDYRVCDAACTAEVAAEIGFPVAVKLLSKDLVHKSEVGAVKVNLNTEAEVEDAVRIITDSVSGYDAMINTNRFLVERMVSPVVAELLVGIRMDESFGLVMVIGGGGILVELLRDTKTLLLPATRADVGMALSSLKTAQLLDGFRGGLVADREQVIDAIMAIAGFAVAHREDLVELDVNPLMVTPTAAVAADVLMRVKNGALWSGR